MKKVLIDPRVQVASFDVDAQQCFTPLCPDELPVPEGHLIVPELNAQAQFAALRVGSKDSHSVEAIWVASAAKAAWTPVHNEENVDMHFPAHAVPGTEGFKSLEGLPAVTEYDYFVWKGMELNLHPYGACFHDLQEKLSSGVIEFLKQNKITTVLVGGLATDYCVKSTVLQLLKANFKVVLNLAACRGINAVTIAHALKEMEQQGAVIIESAACLVHRENKVFPFEASKIA